jgi:hypothetical protein
MHNDFEDAKSGLSEDVYSRSDVMDHTDFIESQTNVRLVDCLGLISQ